ncbi:MAG: Stp1/IreP family PP2C-type Ser/Thr phosphatase [Dethiobacteria bacterium]|nr:Stp1/IreP family PP2C-type Ser/Thr phosphatase [Bacillota bacterium]NMD33631.1 Stp1/IreP family PP2C-type Ser/Thr phosphatase [Bacillota bacterium]HOB28208.1 Stp1/IreP family PP2C-type Ser/Thr phosphatase [Bacillota bacterium]HPZ40815.1 Stp1/IreP family PP2C-type Ser/Thr phosphatase [Bacillota bacterium]HQD51774.1 Stp1/IreP family PP2C-type Ser/Thr phosphatase [Bacillota bacterium]
MRAVGLTHPGRERSRNEDSYLVKTGKGLSILAVADGMGGHVAGDVASALAIGVLERYWNEMSPEKPPPRERFAEIIKNLIKKSNTLILEEAARDSSKRGMGTTLTAGLLRGRSLTIGHVGDSRAYLVSTEALTLLTKDHSLLEQLIQAGRISPEEAEGHPKRHILVRALGTSADVEIDLIDIELSEGAALLFCSDGLTSMVRDEEIHRAALNHPDPLLVAQALIRLANERGGCDNITVIYATEIGR